MEFCIGQEFNESPIAQDIVRAIDATPYGKDWFISLEANNQDLIEAYPFESSGFRLFTAERTGRFSSVTSVDASLLKTIFIKFLEGDATWRAHCEWQETTQDDLPVLTPLPTANLTMGVQANKKPSGLPQWLQVMIVAVIVVSTLTYMFFPGYLAKLQSSLPFANSRIFMFGLIAGLIILGALVFLAIKIIAARRSARWPQAPGRIIKSGMEARHQQRLEEATRVKNVAAVEYEFSVLGKKWNGNRVNVFGDASSGDPAATLARYPVGAVVLVHYDPRNPGNCVLEQELPKDFGKGCAISLAILAVVIGAVIFVSMNAPLWIEIYKPGPRSFIAFAAGGFGLMLLLFFFGVRRASIEAKRWPIVRGKIVGSGTESYNETEDGKTRLLHTATVEYAYSVQGITYHSRQIALSAASAGSEASAKTVAGRYPIGETVDVHYDPNQPENAALEIGGNFHWFIFAAAMLCFVFAVFASGIFQ